MTRGQSGSELTAPAAGAVLPSGQTNACGTPTCYVTVDHLGSTRMVTDSNGNVMRRYDYLPSGEEIPVGTGGRTAGMGYQFNPSVYTLTGGQDGFNPKFTGQVRDWESGLDYFNARYYSPAQGGFVAPDPDNAGADLANSQTWNGYAYVGNNPLSFTDPSGQCWWCDVLGVVLDAIGVLTLDPGSSQAVKRLSAYRPPLRSLADSSWPRGRLRWGRNSRWRQRVERPTGLIRTTGPLGHTARSSWGRRERIPGLPPDAQGLSGRGLGSLLVVAGHAYLHFGEALANSRFPITGSFGVGFPERKLNRASDQWCLYSEDTPPVHLGRNLRHYAGFELH